MTTIYISSLLIILATFLGAGYLLSKAYNRVIDQLFINNKDALDRLYISKGQPPTGVDVTERYEEKQQIAREQRESGNKNKKPPGPLERARATWAEKDLKAKSRGVDITNTIQ